MSIFDYGRNAKQPRGMQECTPEAFDKIIDDPKVEKICAEIQDLREKKLRGEITDKEYKDARTPLKAGLPVFTFQSHYKDGYRKNANAIPSGLSILDIDGIKEDPSSFYNIRMKGIEDALGIVLVHITPSLEGLHVVFKTPAGMDHAEAQKWMASQLNSDYDVCAKDGARCSYAVPREYLLYIDRAKLFNQLTDTPPNLPEGEESNAADNQTVATSRPLVGCSPRLPRGAEGVVKTIEDERGYATSKQTEESPSSGIPSPNLSRSTGEELQNSNTFSPTCGRDQREGMPRANNKEELIGERKSVKLSTSQQSVESVVKEESAANGSSPSGKLDGVFCQIFDICRQFAGLSAVDIETKGMRHPSLLSILSQGMAPLMDIDTAMAVVAQKMPGYWNDPAENGEAEKLVKDYYAYYMKNGVRITERASKIFALANKKMQSQSQPQTPPDLPEGEEYDEDYNDEYWDAEASRPLVGEIERGYAMSQQTEESLSSGIPSLLSLPLHRREEKDGEEEKDGNTFSPTCGRDQREGMPRANNEEELIGERKSVKLSTSLQSVESVVKNFAGLSESISGIPSNLHMQVICSILPLAAAYADGVEVRYCDGTTMKLGLITMVIGEQASGKSSCKTAIKTWMQPMLEEDNLARRQEDEFKQKKSSRRANERLPDDPEVMLRNVPVTISNSALLMRMKHSHGHCLYSFGEELDTLRKANNGGSWADKYDIYRLAFDNGTWGQDYKGEQSESGVVDVSYNLSILGTPRAFYKCFGQDNIENGLSSRILVCLMPDNTFDAMPRYVERTQIQNERILEAVKILRSKSGLYELPKVSEAIYNWVEKRRIEALMDGDKVRGIYRKRSAVIGFRAGVIAYLLNGEQETDEVITFALMIADYCFNTQIRVFGRTLHNLLMSNEHGISSGRRTIPVYQKLQQEFTIDDAHAYLPDHKRSSVRCIVNRWKRDGLIEEVEGGKIPKYKKIY